MLDKLFGLANRIMSHLRARHAPMAGPCGQARLPGSFPGLADRSRDGQHLGQDAPIDATKEAQADATAAVPPAYAPIGRPAWRIGVDGGQFHEASVEEGRHVEDTDCPVWRAQNAGDDLPGPEELDHQDDDASDGDQILIDLLLAPDEECLDEFFDLMEKYPDLVDFFAEMKRRTAAGQSLFRPVGLAPEAPDLLTPVLSPSLADGPDGQGVVGLKLTVGGRILEDTAGYRRNRGKLEAALNIISLYMIHIDYDFPYNIADCYEIILIFKYLSYIISIYSSINSKQRGYKFIIN